MEQNFILGQCPKCMQSLRVPSALEAFSCMYCGARLTQSDLLCEPATPAPADESAYQSALTQLPTCILPYRGWHKRVTKTDYAPAFDEYESACRSVVLLLDAGVSGLSEAEQNAKLEAAAAHLIDALAADWATTKKSDRNALDNDKYIVALFFVPMVLRQKTPSGRPFVEALHQLWLERYPKSPFYIGDYDSLMAGFRKKFLGLCFITTAVCESSGKPDDCAELTAFRAFRDGYLRAQSDGAALIEEYYRIAPTIVMCINACGDRDARYAAIRQQHLQPCYESLCSGDFSGCKTRYVRMVRALEKEYLN